MRILIVSPIVKPEIGGPATYVEGLVGQSKPGFECKVVSFWSERLLKRDRNGGVKLVGTGGNFLIRQGKLMREIWRASKDVDVIYALDPLTVGVASVLVGKLRGKPVVVRFAGDVGWEKAMSYESLAVSLDEYLLKIKQFSIFNFQLWRYWLQGWVLRSAQAVVVPGEYLRKLLMKYYGLGEEKVEVIRNAVEVRGGLGIRKLGIKDYQIVAVGRLVRWKNFDLLIKVFPRITKKNQKLENRNLKLVIVGEGPERGRLEELAGELKVEDQVKFLGRLSREEAWRVVRQSGVLVLPSSYEGMSHVLIEAMALGVPVVASDIEANREVVEDGKTGLLFSLEDKEGLARCLERLLENERLSNKFVGSAKKKVEKYNWRRHIEQLGGLFSRIRNQD